MEEVIEPDGQAPDGGRPGMGSRALRNTMLVIAARIVSRALALVTVLVMANRLQATRFGQFSVLVNDTAVVSVLLDLGFNTLYIREGAREPDQLSHNLQSIMAARLAQSLPVVAILTFWLWTQHLQWLAAGGFVLMMLTSYSNLLRGTFYALGRLSWEAIAIVLESVFLAVLVLAGVWLREGVAYFVWAYAASYGFSCAYFVFAILRTRVVRMGLRWDPAWFWRWFRIGLPFALTFILTTIYFKIDVPILYQLRGAGEVGTYTSAYKPFEALLFVPVSMLNVVFPVLGVYHRQSPHLVSSAIDRFFKALALLGWPITVGTFILAPGLSRLMHLLPGAEPSLRILSLAVVLMFVSNAFIAALNSMDRQDLFTWAAGISVGVNLALNFLLIPRWGYLGASWATVLTELGLTIIGWTLVARRLHPVPVLRLTWKIGLAGVVMGVALLPFRAVVGPAVLAAVVVGAVAYVGAVLLLRVADDQEWSLIRGALGRAQA